MPARYALLLCLLLGSAASASELRVAVAANFSESMKRIATLFGERSGHRPVLSSGASGAFFAQIRSGAPFDVLLAADRKVPAALVEAGLAVPGSQRTYARGRLALWSADPALVDAAGAVLEHGHWRHLAIANPRLAPYGAAAMQVLEARGLAARLAPRLVQGESITQAWQFVATGNAEIGFVAWSQVIASARRPARGSVWLVPEEMHEPILQDLVLLERARDNRAARDLLEFMRAPEVIELIRAAGYEVPP